MLFYEVIPPQSSSQKDPLDHSRHHIEEIVSSAAIEGARKGNHRDLFSASGTSVSSTIQDDLLTPPLTASSNSSTILHTSTNTMEKENVIVATANAIGEIFQEESTKGGEDSTNVVNNMIDEEDETIDDDNDDHEDESLELLGVSVDHFQNVLYPQFLKAGHGHHSKVYVVENLKNAAHGFSSVIRDKGVKAFCPLDGQRGSSYVHALMYDSESSAGKQYMLESEDGGDPNPYGPASIMISYSWDYAIGDILDTITAYCEMNNLDKKCTYFWIDCLCINLHRVVELKEKELELPEPYDYSQDEKKCNASEYSKPAIKDDVMSMFASSEDLESTIQHRVQKIGHLLAIMTPFHEPTFLSRLWCLYELGVANAAAHKNHGDLPCRVTIAIPPQQKESLMAAIETDTINTINKMYDLMNVKVSSANTTVEEDSTYILDLIQQGQPQRPRSRNNDRYHGFHNMMKNLIRGWVTNILTSSVEEKTRIYMDEHNDGNIDFNFEEMKAKTTTFAEEELAQFYNQAAYAFRKNNENEFSLELYRNALRIKEALLELQVVDNNDFTETLAQARGESKQKQASSSFASTYNNISIVLQKLGHFDEALEMLQKCLEIREAALGTHNTTTASTYNSMSEILEEKGDLVEALDMNMKGLETFESILGPSHPSTATIYDSIASQLQSMGQLDEAMAMYRKALTIKEAELGNHITTAKSYESIASLLEDKGEIEDALRMYKKCARIQEAAIGATHPDTAAIYNNIARIQHGLGQKGEALKTWNKALVVLKENIGPDHTQVLVQALVDKLRSK